MNRLCQWVQRYGPLLARLLMAQLFIISGFGKMLAFNRTAAMLANHDFPMPEVMLVLTIAVEFGGGILLIAGWRVRCVATALFVFTLAATLVFHPVWRVEPEAAKAALNQFIKNLSIMGGLLYMVVFGAGPLSIGSDACGGEPTNDVSGKKKKQ
jgi:putative oxidoreductase